MLQAILVGLVAVFMILDSRLLGRMNFEQPLITCTLVGLVMGNVQAGLAVGVTMEMITLGLMNVGASGGMSMGMNLGSIISCAYVIKSGVNVEMALAIATPIAVITEFLLTLWGIIEVFMIHLCDKYVDEGKFAAARRMHIVWGPVGYSLVNFNPAFIAVYAGGDVISRIIEKIPGVILSGFSLGANIMAFYGFALLLSIMVTKKTVVFFLIGFMAVAYSGIGLIAVSIMGALLAVVLYLLKYDHNVQAEVADELD